MRTSAALTGRRMLAESAADQSAAVRFLAAARVVVGAMVEDHVICTQPWGFRLAGVRVPVHVWHGMQDGVVPIDDAMHLIAELPRVQAALHPDEGHFFYRRRLLEILGDLAACASDEAAHERAQERRYML